MYKCKINLGLAISLCLLASCTDFMPQKSAKDNQGDDKTYIYIVNPSAQPGLVQVDPDPFDAPYIESYAPRRFRVR